jgi:hypothetical protein
MNSAMTTERKANPTFANLSSVTKVETDHPYLLWSHSPKLAKASSIGADSEKIKTAVMGNKQTMVNTIAKLLLKIIDWIERIYVVYLRSIE